MDSFKPSIQHYAPRDLNDGREIKIVNIVDIAPCLQRAELRGVFCDKDQQNTAKDRVVSILNGFREGNAIEPNEIKVFQGEGNYHYQMHHGSHRLHCSIAVGFFQIPTVFSWASLRRRTRLK
ncbi:MAG: hypothetical protein JKY67_02700 [Pseudomonadales bacterium]|nr:hypothetical protein [Pseudomonadales bacterium]